ncbi:MAG: hypothetical protein HUK40_16010 [Desulfobacter sp.]|nr:hypothetical protein [Desulfobacter sp.]WDP87124.1 MAG: hypothetical protein HUN05_19975 [Desulfobacter sp.]
MKRIFITIYILLLGTLFTIPLGVGPIVKALFKDEVLKAERAFARGTFSLLAERLGRLDPGKRQEELEVLQNRFGYPLTLLTLSEVDVDKGDQADFLKGLIVEIDEQETLVMRLPASN